MKIRHILLSLSWTSKSEEEEELRAWGYFWMTAVDQIGVWWDEVHIGMGVWKLKGSPTCMNLHNEMLHSFLCWSHVKGEVVGGSVFIDWIVDILKNISLTANWFRRATPTVGQGCKRNIATQMRQASQQHSAVVFA